jgi:hypothetical protein
MNACMEQANNNYTIQGFLLHFQVQALEAPNNRSGGRAAVAGREESKPAFRKE